MRDEKRIDLIMVLMKELWSLEQCRDLRFWQLVCLMENHARKLFNIEDVWNMEEDKWKKVIEDLIKNYTK